MTKTVLVDDHLLLDVLLGDEPRGLRRRATVLATTGLWYHRLSRALSGPGVAGAFSSRLGGLDDEVASRVVAAVIELPEQVGLVSMRELAWPMAELIHAGARLNLLSLEALAAARHISAEICLAGVDHNQPLVAAAVEFGVEVRIVSDR